MSGNGDKESTPTAEFISSKGLLSFACVHLQYGHNIHRRKTQTGDVLRVDCHVYNSTSPGFSGDEKDAHAFPALV